MIGKLPLGAFLSKATQGIAAPMEINRVNLEQTLTSNKLVQCQ